MSNTTGHRSSLSGNSRGGNDFFCFPNFTSLACDICNTITNFWNSGNVNVDETSSVTENTNILDNVVIRVYYGSVTEAGRCISVVGNTENNF